MTTDSLKCRLFGHKPDVFWHEDKKLGIFIACIRCGSLNIKSQTHNAREFKEWASIRTKGENG